MVKASRDIKDKNAGQGLALGLLPTVLKDISFAAKTADILPSPYYKTALSIFNWLRAHQREDGSILDPNVSSTLDAQYHHANMGLGGVVLFLLTGDAEYYERAYRAFKYYSDVPPGRKDGGMDFSNFPFLVSCMLLHGRDGQCRLRDLLKGYVDDMTHHAGMEKGATYGNNFVTFRALNHLLRFKILGEGRDQELADAFMGHSLKWQFDDGVFYDFPRGFNDKNGIPSLAYHAKITLITLLYGIIAGDKNILERALTGLDALEKLTANDGEAFYYGRTNNALYGYACGILAMRTASNYLREGRLAEGFKACETALFRFCSRHGAKDGHLYIVPNDLEDQRCGFDNYMYVAVYNAFTMSMLLLSTLMRDTVSPAGSTEAGVHWFKDSGFIIKKSDRISVAFNLKGHNYCEQYLLDPRFTCAAPLFVKYGASDILPSIPFSYPNPAAKAESPVKKIRRRLVEAFSEIGGWSMLRRYNPLYAGFIPYLVDKNDLYMPLHITESEVSESDGILYIRVSGGLVSVKAKGLWPFALSMAEAVRGRLKAAAGLSRQRLVRETGDAGFRRTIVISDDFILFRDAIETHLGGEAFFSVRTYSDGRADTADGNFRFEAGGHGFVLTLENGDTVNKGITLGSSKGKARCWDIANKDKYLSGDGRKTVTLEHTLIPYDSQNSLNGSLERLNSLAPSIHRRLNA